jgi:predicted dehydrogenase
MTTKVGLIGLGVISRFYLDACIGSPDVALTAVCDRNPSRLDKFDRTEVLRFEDYRDFARCDAFDHAVVCLPNNIHFDVCRTLLEAGKHVCCEKPLTLKLGDGEDLLATAEQADRLMFTAFHRRYNKPYLNLKKRLAGHEIASVRVTYNEKIEDHAGEDAWYLDPTVCGGGCIADNGPNAFDLVRDLLGPTEVTSVDVLQRRRGVDIEAVVDMVDATGRTARINLDWAWPHGESKTVTVRLTNGEEMTADMLDGFPAFKSSLVHEYEAILSHFIALASEPNANHAAESGLDAVRFVHRCYNMAAVTP